MLAATHKTLQEAQTNAQTADHRSHELMGLYGWAMGGTGMAGVGGSNAKVEIFQDPGTYDGSASKFEEWWTKMNVTVRGRGLLFSVVHLPPLTINSPFTFTVLIMFFADTFRYIVW